MNCLATTFASDIVLYAGLKYEACHNSMPHDAYGNVCQIEQQNITLPANNITSYENIIMTMLPYTSHTAQVAHLLCHHFVGDM